MKRPDKTLITTVLKSSRLFWALTAVVIVLSCLAVTKGTMQMVWAQDEVAAIQAVNAKLKAKNSILLRKVESLKTDRAALEAIIRQDLGMIRPNEVVYVETAIATATP